MAAEAEVGITTRMVRYGNALEAFLAVPERAGPHPCVILLHERYGLVQHTRDLAMRFARDGYLCLAPNLYSRFAEQARLATGELQVPLPDPQVLDDLNASIAYLETMPAADLRRLALMGVCLTGRFPLVVAAHRTDIGACLVFYGAAQPREWEVNERQPEPLETLIGRVRCPVLGIFGEADHLITVDDVRRFRDALERQRKSYHLRLFAGAPHGWLNDTMPGRYRREAAEEAWRLTLAFLERVWCGAYPPERVRWTFESDTALDYDPRRNVRLE
ncbi:MAG TPA: dienelactone hydrolase family protein [Chloroflexota bacterium]|nr:dienelactone hydrolase family protein [Chloroflexota bacterium]